MFPFRFASQPVTWLHSEGTTSTVTLVMTVIIPAFSWVLLSLKNHRISTPPIWRMTKKKNQLPRLRETRKDVEVGVGGSRAKVARRHKKKKAA